MVHYAYFHQKLLITKSLAATIDAVASLPPQYWAYRKSTSLEALSTAVRLSSKLTSHEISASDDEELADRYRLQIELLIKRVWRKRRQVTTETIQELECYTEARPQMENGLFNLAPTNCDPERECCLAQKLRGSKDILVKLRNAIPESSTRREDTGRRQVLKQLINTPNRLITREQCRQLGDAIFAFCAPEDCDILTTNRKDHLPLAAAIGKSVESP